MSEFDFAGQQEYYNILNRIKEEDASNRKNIIEGGFTSVTNIPLSSPPAKDFVANKEAATTLNYQQRQAVDPIASLDAEMRRIAGIEDPNEKFMALTRLRGYGEGKLAEFRGNAYDQASNEFKVRELEANLRQNIEADRADPNYPLYQTDSDMTKRARAQYDAALTASRTRGASIYESNPVASQMAGMITTFMEMQMRALERTQAKNINREAKAQALLDQFGTGHLELAGVIAPGGDNVQTAAREYKNVAFREAAMAMNSPADLVPMALAEGNIYAKKGLVHKQAVEISGTSDKNSASYRRAFDEAEKDFNAMKKITLSDPAFKEAMKVRYPNKDQYNKAMENYLLTGQTASGAREQQKIRADYAPQLLADAKQREFLGNVAGWADSKVLQDPSTSISKVYSTVSKRLGQGAPMSLQALASGIRGLPKEEQAKAQEELISVALSSKEKVAKGYYGNFADTIDIRNMVISSMASVAYNDWLLDPTIMGIEKGFLFDNPFIPLMENK